MSKFTIKVKLQALEIEVEGTRDDAPKIYQQLGKQMSGLLQSPAVLATGNGNVVLEGDVPENEVEPGKKPRKPRKGGSGGRTPAELLNFAHDSAQYGSPLQGWTTAQKAIWFLHVVAQQAKVTQQTATSIAKNFNRLFRAAGQINNGNVMTALEKERLKGASATVNADMTDGTAKYFLTLTGTAVAQKLARGETVNAD